MHGIMHEEIKPHRSLVISDTTIAVEAPIDFLCKKDLEWVGVKHKAGSSFRLLMSAFYDVSASGKFEYVRIIQIIIRIINWVEFKASFIACHCMGPTNVNRLIYYSKSPTSPSLVQPQRIGGRPRETGRACAESRPQGARWNPSEISCEHRKIKPRRRDEPCVAKEFRETTIRKTRPIHTEELSLWHRHTMPS